jgi:hypothetical protein
LEKVRSFGVGENVRFLSLSSRSAHGFSCVSPGHEPDANEPLDLNAERARLAKEQADKTQMENAVARGELLRRRR